MVFIPSRNRQAPSLRSAALLVDKVKKLCSAGAATALLSLGLFAPSAAHAVDGCLVLLCFAAPSWKSIPQCVQ